MVRSIKGLHRFQVATEIRVVLAGEVAVGTLDLLNGGEASEECHFRFRVVGGADVSVA